MAIEKQIGANLASGTLTGTAGNHGHAPAKFKNEANFSGQKYA
jgi:hypothetical protein